MEFWGFLIDGCLYFEEQIQNVEKKRKFLNITFNKSFFMYETNWWKHHFGLLFVVP